MLTLSNVPNEIYLVALDYEQIDRPEDAAEAADTHHNITTTRAWTSGGFERAVHEYMTLAGPFAEDGGEFAGVNGYQAS